MKGEKRGQRGPRQRLKKNCSRQEEEVKKGRQGEYGKYNLVYNALKEKEIKFQSEQINAKCSRGVEEN